MSNSPDYLINTGKHTLNNTLKTSTKITFLVPTNVSFHISLVSKSLLKMNGIGMAPDKSYYVLRCFLEKCCVHGGCFFPSGAVVHFDVSLNASLPLTAAFDCSYLRDKYSPTASRRLSSLLGSEYGALPDPSRRGTVRPQAQAGEATNIWFAYGIRQLLK